MSVTIILPDNKRLNIKTTFNSLLSEILEKVCTHKGLDSSTHTLHRNERALDISLSLRLAGIPLNSELNLVHDPKKNVNQQVNVSIQYQDRPRKTGQFTPSQTLWQVIEILFSQDCSQIRDDSLVFSINFMNKQFEGKDILQSTTLKLMGILNGRVMFRMDSRSIESKGTQKFVENIKFKKPELSLAKEQENLGKSIQPSQNQPMDVDEQKKVSSIEIPKDGSSEPGPSGQSKKFVQENVVLKQLMNLKQSTAKTNKALTISSSFISESGNSDQFDKDLEKEIKYLGGQNYELFYSIDDSPKFIEQSESDDFFEHTSHDLKHLLADLRRHQIGSSDSQLEVRQTREEREKSEQSKFGQTIIRIIFPYDRLILQAFFKPTDSIGAVISVVKKYTKQTDIHLFTAPPKTILPESATLAQLKLVPTGSIYCGSNNKETLQLSLIKDQFVTQITSFSVASKTAIYQMKSIFQKSKENKTG